MRTFRPSAQIPAGYWRGIDSSAEAFAREIFLDEYAHASQVDPLELRRRYYRSDSRSLRVINLAAEKAGWGTPLPAGRGRGIAYHATWGVTHVAEVAEVSTGRSGDLRVERVVCAVDCGLVINPDLVRAQMESGIIFGLTAVLKNSLVIEQGRVASSNFHDYPILRYDERPVIEVHLVSNQDPPTGVGEMGNPPLAPAVLNAIFAATGKRLRRIPIRKDDFL